MTLEDKMKKDIKIPEILEMFDFVRWDRYTEREDGNFHRCYYGWIDREDKKKDFLVLVFSKDGRINYITSSTEKHYEINKVLGIYNQPPRCKRVEHKWDIKNSIKL